MEKPQTWFAEIICLNTSKLAKVFYRCVFLLVYFCLLVITTIAIIKANAMIVIPIVA